MLDDAHTPIMAGRFHGAMARIFFDIKRVILGDAGLLAHCRRFNSYMSAYVENVRRSWRQNVLR